MYYKKIKSANKDEHILLMEEYLGRSLEEGEIVHHVDNDRSNNDLENLELCLKHIHSRYHQKQGDYFNIAEWNKKNARGYKHGTYSCWRNQKCRCELCIQAQREYKKAGQEFINLWWV